MAFNFGAFVGGLSQGVVKGIEDEEQRQHEFDKMAKTEAMRQAAASRARRAQKQEALEASIGALKFLGYNDQAAAAIAQQGAVAVEMAVDAGQKAMQKGKNINTILSMPNVGEDIESSKPEIDSTIDGPKKPTIGMFDAQAYKGLYEEPDEVSNSYGERLAIISQKQATLAEDSKEYQDLQSEKTILLRDVAAYHEAQREQKGEDAPDPSLFNLGTIEATVNSVQSRALSEFKFELSDIDRAIAKRIDGDEGRYGVAMMKVAEELQSTYGSLDDALMNDKIEFLRAEAVKNLDLYARQIATKSDSAYHVAKSSAAEAMAAVQQKQVKIGDVIIWEDNGVQKIAVYTGYNDPSTNVPLIMVD